MVDRFMGDVFWSVNESLITLFRKLFGAIFQTGNVAEDCAQ